MNILRVDNLMIKTYQWTRCIESLYPIINLFLQYCIDFNNLSALTNAVYSIHFKINNNFILEIAHWFYNSAVSYTLEFIYEFLKALHSELKYHSRRSVYIFKYEIKLILNNFILTLRRIGYIFCKYVLLLIRKI